MLGRSKLLSLWWIGLNKTTFFVTAFLLTFGCAMVFSVGYSASVKTGGGDMVFFIKHMVFCLIGVAAMFILSITKRVEMMRTSVVGLLFCMTMLVAVLLVGGSTKGAKRWIDLGFLTIQPSELLKPFYIIVTSYLMLEYHRYGRTIYLGCVAVLYLITCALLFLEPDFGMIIIFTAITCVQFYISNIEMRKIIIPAVFGLPSVFMAAFFGLEHVRFRIMNFFGHSHSADNYQSKLAMKAIKNGGLFGSGVGDGRLKFMIPDSHNDFIFSIICEEWGMIAGFAIFLGYLYMAASNLRFLMSENTALDEIRRRMAFPMASSMRTRLRQYADGIIFSRHVVCTGLCMIFIEAFINVSVSLSLIPTKGMTLPFVSYGGSSAISHLILMGFILACNRQKYRFLGCNLG